MSIDITQLSPEEKRKLQEQILAEEKAEKEKIKETKATYKELAEEFVVGNIDNLVFHKTLTEKLVKSVMNDFNTVKDLKQEAFGVKEQDSHTTTLKDGSASITIGHNVIIKFDGTESAGIEKIKDYMKSLSSDSEKAQKLGKIVDKKLKVNQKTGFLNPSSIIDLNSLRDEFNDERFSEGLDIIIAAQIRTVNSMYVSGWKYIKEDGVPKKLDFRFTI